MEKEDKKNKKKKRGFTLIELLAVIVILAILLVITVPNVLKQVKLAKQKAYFISVSNLVENIKADNVLNNGDYCMYDYSKDTENKNENIDDMYVLVHKEDNDLIYSVYATNEEQKTINVYDFSTIDKDDSSNWDNLLLKSSAYHAVEEVLAATKDEDDNITYEYLKYTMCGTKK